MRGYRRLGLEEREEISRMLVVGMSFRAIARRLNREVSTISREVKKEGRYRWWYRAARAERRAMRNAQSRKRDKRKLFLKPDLAKLIQEKLCLCWSPEQIARWLQQSYTDRAMHVSAETIYTYLYVLPRGELKKELLRGLRHGHKRRWRKDRRLRKGMGPYLLEDMLSIEERPAEVTDRSIPGHWEGDLLIGGMRQQSALGTLVERTTRTVLLVPLKGKSAREVRRAFAAEVKRLPEQMRLSLTYDQGREMAQHKLFTKQTRMKVYFAHPRSPWERGTNENTNGLIRQFFPKGTDFTKVSKREIKKVQNLLNGRPRKVLNWKTPFEVVQQLLH